MTDNSVQLSACELEVLALAWQCMGTSPGLDPNQPPDHYETLI